MTVAEVIAALQKCDPAAEVIVGSQGWGCGGTGTGRYENGVDEHDEIEINDLETRVVIQPTGIT